MKEAQKEVDKLLTDNATLMAKLGEAEKSILQFKADGAKKDARNRCAPQGSHVPQGPARQGAEGERRLPEADGRFAAAPLDGEHADRGNEDRRGKERGGAHAPAGRKSNPPRHRLRGQKEEARRSQTKKLVLGELEKLENKSKVLMDQIEYLSGPVVKLSDKERGLFKKPELQISDAEISLSAPRNETAVSDARVAPSHCRTCRSS